MKEQIKNKKKFGSGFTLVEALVAVSIILVGVTAAFGTAQLGLSSTSAVRNRITAMFLAPEALEGVKNIKDSNLQKISLNNSGINWLEGISIAGAAPCGSECGYDVITDSLSSCSDIGGCKIYLDDNFYRQMADGVTETGFVRQISVEEIVTGFEARVTVVVSRSSGNFPPFTVVSLLHNWF